jgi:hypothetical protein
MAGDLSVPSTIQSRTQLDEWLSNIGEDKLSTTNREAIRDKFGGKLGLDMGNALAAYGVNDPAATTFERSLDNNQQTPTLDPEAITTDGVSDSHQFDQLRSAANQFSDPFLIDIASVLRLMHETSVSMQSAMKQLREVENQNSQAQMQASAEAILSSGQFQAIAGGISAGMSIAGGATAIASAGGGLKSLKGLNDQVKSGLADAPDMPKMTKTALDNNDVELPKVDAELDATPTPAKSEITTRPRSNAISEDRAPFAEDAPAQSSGEIVTRPRSNAITGDKAPFAEDGGRTQEDVSSLKKDLASAESSATETPPKLTKAEYDMKMQEISLISSRWQASGQMIDGVGKALNAGIGSMASAQDSAKAIFDKQASQAQFVTQQSSDLIKALADNTQQILQTMQSIQQAEKQAADRVASV